MLDVCFDEKGANAIASLVRAFERKPSNLLAHATHGSKMATVMVATTAATAGKTILG